MPATQIAAGQRSNRLRITDPRRSGATAAKQSAAQTFRSLRRSTRSTTAIARSAAAPHIHMSVSNARRNPADTCWFLPGSASPGKANIGSAPGGYSTAKSR